MKTAKTGFTGLVLCGVAAVAAAADYQWKTDGRQNDWDWTDSRNFVLKGTETEGAPQANDTVFVPDGLTVKARSSDATSFARVLELGRIEPMGPNAWVVFDVADEATYTGAFTAWNGIVSTSRNKGGFVKTGAGTLNLSLADRNNYTTIEVREGAVKVPQTAATQFLDTIAVSNGASFFVNAGGYTSMDRLCGEGLVTNTASTAQVLQITDASDEPGEFSGVISSGIQLVSEGGTILLTGTNSAFGSITVKSNKGALTEGGYIGLRTIGAESEASSAGKVQSLNFQTDGGGFKYLGEGETATKFLNVFSSIGSYPAFLDGGPNGGLTLSGYLQFTTDYALKFFFGGENTNLCTFAGNIRSVAGGYSSGFISKYGAGTWRFKDVSQRWFSGGFGILDGTLQFETIAEAGKKSSLGTADSVYEDWYAGPVSSAPKADYAYVFGGTNAVGAATGKGLFEYVGADNAVVTSRQAVVNGMGGLKADNGAIRFVGVKAKNASGAKTLVLSGSGLTNEVQDVADGAGTLSVLKEGSGTWYMSGSNTFSGTVSVKAGTLYVRDPSLYRWYRFNIRDIHKIKTESNRGDPDGDFNIYFFGFYDANGVLQNPGMRQGQSMPRLLPGEAGFMDGVTYVPRWEYGSNTYGYLTNAFVDAVGNASRFQGKFKDASGNAIVLDPDDESTWARVIMRVTDDAAPITSYDFVQSGWYEYWEACNVDIWSLDGSTDGLRWDELTEKTDMSSQNLWKFQATPRVFWRCAEEFFYVGSSAANHTTGKQIAAFKANPLPSFNNAGAVSVAPGATLKTDATQNVTLRALAIDANGMGTIENFAFAEEGTVEFLNVGDRTVMPGTYVNCKDLGNLANWSVKADGKDKPAWKVAVKDGVVSVVKPGMTIIVK